MKNTGLFLIITGMSGAGKNFAIKCLEDGGYFCVDNLPTDLIPKFGELFINSSKAIKNAACIVDVRDRNFAKNIVKNLMQLDDLKIKYELLFLDSKNETLLRRFNETRRPHPLSKRSVLAGIKKERKLLREVKGLATIIINTSDFNPKQLKEFLWNKFVNTDNLKKMTVNIISFGFKNGLPPNIDLLFDARFLPNPYYISDLAKKTGDDIEVRDYIFKWPVTEKFMKHLENFIEFLLPQYVKEGKTYLTIGIGCTGGQHRSVMVASLLYDFIKKLDLSTITVTLEHRDKTTIS